MQTSVSTSTTPPETGTEISEAFGRLHQVVSGAAGRETDMEHATEILRASTAYTSAVFNATGFDSARISRRRPLLVALRKLLGSLGAGRDGVTRATRLYQTPQEMAEELTERTVAGYEQGKWGPWFLDATLEALLELEQIDTLKNIAAAREHLRSLGWCSRSYDGYCEDPEYSTVVVWHHPDLPGTPPVHSEIDADACRTAELAANMAQTLAAWRAVPDRPKVPSPAEDRAHKELYSTTKYAFLEAREPWLRLAYHRGDPGPLVSEVWGVSEAFPAAAEAA